MALVHHPAILAFFGYSALLTVVQIWAIISRGKRFRQIHSMLDGISTDLEVLSAKADALEKKSCLKNVA